MKHFTILVVSFAVLGFSSLARSEDKLPKLNLSPVILDTQDGEGSTIGLEFELSGTKKMLKSNEPADSNSLVIENLDYHGFAIAYNVAGTATADEERNPKNFLDALVDFEFLSSSSKGDLTGGGFLKYEADQSFDSQQSVYGLRATYGKLNVIRQNDFVALDVGRGQVDPNGDKARETALGTTSLKKYYRTDVEFLYMLPINEVIPILDKAVQSFEFNYRYFRESSAPEAVKTAGLDSFFLRTFRLNLKKDLFIAYSNGKLPFDLQGDKFFELGFSYNLQ